MNQYFNGDALKTFLTLKSPSLLLPHYTVQDVSHIPYDALRRHGFRALVLDKDNTLTVPYSLSPHPRVKESIETMKQVFPEKCIIFSNHAGSNNDKGYVNATKIENSLGLPVLRHVQQKPSGMLDVQRHLSVNPQEVVVIGDRYMTDILFGNLNGCLTIYSVPLVNHGENVIVRMVFNSKRGYYDANPRIPATHLYFFSAGTIFGKFFGEIPYSQKIFTTRTQICHPRTHVVYGKQTMNWDGSISI
eukprot:TRINITY_DN8270_c0_g1_i1.p1 TRINITY_DN8270_c0_g1~~TRINITY_DN8270_c0_g1_i1.p1  ORF type:complete len:246 (+),score=20.65 TRINITY_DN8270_c0_g1_i1:428-1165(+)